MRILPFEYTRMQEGVIDHFVVIIDGQDRAHLLRIDVNDIGGELITDEMNDFYPDTCLAALTDDKLIETASDWIGTTFYYAEHDCMGDDLRYISPEVGFVDQDEEYL